MYIVIQGREKLKLDKRLLESSRYSYTYLPWGNI
jgi:hypothetical protein